MDDNAGDASGSAYEDAYDEKESLVETLEGYEDDEEEYEEELEELELEALWDLTAASHDAWVMAYAAYESAEEYLEWAEEDYEDADAAWYAADEELWEAQFEQTNSFSNDEYFAATQRVDEAQMAYDDADNWWINANDNLEFAYEDLEDATEAWEEAEEDYANYDYDPTQEYNTYDDWEAPDNFDDMFEEEEPEADLCSEDFESRAGDNKKLKCLAMDGCIFNRVDASCRSPTEEELAAGAVIEDESV